MTLADLAGYIVGQFLGGIVGAGALAVIMKSKEAGYYIAKFGLGQNGWGHGYLGEYGLWAAIVFEFVATFLFIVVILGSTQKDAPSAMAGLAIGITLVVIHIVGIQITGVSVNPARSFGPALLVRGTALVQVWLFLVVPSLAGILAGLAFRWKALSAS
jgi:aquaporin Z